MTGLRHRVPDESHRPDHGELPDQGDVLASMTGDPVTRVADSFVDLMRTFVKARQALMQATQHDVEWTSHVILRCLKSNGPMRAGAIADQLNADPSTVSRQVAAIVKDGLAERRADPEDGRASLLVLTDRADDVLAEYDRLRTSYFAELLEGWSTADIDQLGALLERFAVAYRDRGGNWLAERLAANRPSAAHPSADLDSHHHVPRSTT